MAAKSQGPIAVVTGAGSGMGAETAKALAADGAVVVLVGRRLSPLATIKQEITAAGGSAHVRAVDITDPATAETLVSWVEDHLGPIDVLVNNAGSSSPVQNPQYIDDDQWAGVIDVNLDAVFRLTRAVLPSMLARETGTIVTISSLAAVTPNLLGGAAYGAAKAAVRNFMTFLHTTFRNQGLRAITILPGETDTPILDNRAQPPSAELRGNMVQPVDVARTIALAVALPQRVVLQEIVVAPTRQRDVAADLEISRWTGAPAGARP